jgi:aminobenzoyl-glutamate utilization protein B
VNQKSFFIFTSMCLAFASVAYGGDKSTLLQSIDARCDEAWEDALHIWEWAEPGYQEVKSAALLSGTLEEAGFTVERGVADIPTAFVASIGSGSPVIGILGEFDALPGLAQECVPTRAPREGNGYGHACGHHLFGAGSMLAALALGDALQRGDMPGTVRFYGTPAEEGGAAKVYMVRAGLFDDCDAVLHWHPGDRNTAGDPTNLARFASKFRFHGQAAHAAGSPEQGRSALDAVELMDYAAELMREHTPDFTRIHHVITSGGDAPNVVPAFAEVYYYVRHPDPRVVRDLQRRLVLCAQAGAIATETQLEIESLGGTYNLLPNNALTDVTQRNLRELTHINYTDEEVAFAREIQKTLPNPAPLSMAGKVIDRDGDLSRSSTDVGDVSWVVPTTGFRTACWVPGTPAHTWQATAAGGTSIGRKGMELAAHVLAATAWDLAHDPDTLSRARDELKRRTEYYRYDAMLEPGQKPPLDYRNPPSLN